MLNFYYVYSVIWSLVLILYDFRWSDLCEPLCPELRLFLYITIGISFVSGFQFRKDFKFKKKNIPIANSKYIPIIIIVIQFAEYLYEGNIPIFNVIFQGGSYKDFAGIPTLHVILYTFVTFYLQCLFYSFLCTKDKKKIVSYILIAIIVFGFQVMRGGIIICIGISGFIYLSYIREKIKIRHIIISMCFCLLLVYCFGGIGNMRHGFAWGDSRSFMSLGKINSNYPTWLPNQFAWGYIYITSGLANLNYNISNKICILNSTGFLRSLFPDFLEKRIFTVPISSNSELIVKALNSTTGYMQSYSNIGILGMYLTFFLLLSINFIIISSLRKSNNYEVPVKAIACMIVALYFFTNSIKVSAVSFPIVYPLLLGLFRIKKYHEKVRYRRNMYETKK